LTWPRCFQDVRPLCDCSSKKVKVSICTYHAIPEPSTDEDLILCGEIDDAAQYKRTRSRDVIYGCPPE
jgi:hypothetical protein